MEFEVYTLKELVERNIRTYKDGIAYQMRGKDGNYRKWSYGEVGELIKKVQATLSQKGIRPGDKVALISENRAEWPIAYFAVAGMGAVNVPLDAMQTKEDILPLIKDSGAKLIITSRQFAEYSKKSQVEGRELFMEEFDALPLPANPAENNVCLDDLAAIVYTSGTTGTPKGVMLTHRNIMFDLLSSLTCFDITPADNLMTVLPMHHSYETCVGIIAPFIEGCTKTIPETLKSYAIIKNMEETKVTILGSVPMFWRLLYDGIWRQAEETGKGKILSVLFALSKFFNNILRINLGRILFKPVHAKFGGKLRLYLSGGAALDPELSRDFNFMGMPILQGYGLTETSPVIAIESPAYRRNGSAGKIISGIEVKIAGSESTGEIIVSGPIIMKGYYKQKELTDEVIKGGWLHTGDIGYIDKDGYIYISGRIKDIIVTGSGVNVYPYEIEAALDKLPSIKESCVLGGKIKEGVRRGTEEVLAVLIPDLEYFEKLGNKADGFIKEKIAGDIAAYNAKATGFKRIQRYFIRQEVLPRTRLLKIKRFKIRMEVLVD